MKKEALAEFLECGPEDLEQASHDSSLFERGLESYLVLDDAEATSRTIEAILDSLWAFNIDFILSHSNIDTTAYNEDKIKKALQKMQEKLCEDANPIIEALLVDQTEFVEDAIEADGRGHFLSSYDGEESEVGDFYIYRQN